MRKNFPFRKDVNNYYDDQRYKTSLQLSLKFTTKKYKLNPTNMYDIHPTTKIYEACTKSYNIGPKVLKLFSIN